MENYIQEEALVSELYEALSKDSELSLEDGAIIKLEGWIKTNRDNGSIGFIELSDGSCFKSIQLVYDKNEIDNYDQVSKYLTGTAISIKGNLIP